MRFAFPIDEQRTTGEDGKRRGAMPRGAAKSLLRWGRDLGG
jgi:hypothetical protein